MQEQQERERATELIGHGQSLATLTPTLISSKMTYLSIEYIHTRKIVVLNEYNRVDMFNADKVSSSRRK